MGEDGEEHGGCDHDGGQHGEHGGYGGDQFQEGYQYEDWVCSIENTTDAPKLKNRFAPLAKEEADEPDEGTGPGCRTSGDAWCLTMGVCPKHPKTSHKSDSRM